MTQISLVLRNARNQLNTALSLAPNIAALEAQILLAHALNQSRAYLLAHPEATLNESTVFLFTDLLHRRLKGEPIAYILGHREFFGFDFCVTPDVLIPRPETELLVTLALERIPLQHPIQVLDLGTGSGAIAVTLAKLRPQALVTAVDISPCALAVARQNAARLGTSNVRFIQSDWFEALDPSKQFDLIVSNPPYIAVNDPHLQQGDVRFEPISALHSGAGGLDAIRHIAQEFLRFSAPNGWLLFEHGFNQQRACADIMTSLNFTDIFFHLDLADHPRVSGGKKS